jgi:cellulose 1,4-beta-cellobiosidase
MDEDGGMSKHPSNKAGAKYGTGYCDAQCPHDMKWINGEANCDGWVPAGNDPNSGTGKYGTCCFEMDIWEANSQAQSFTPHNCDVTEAYRCEGVECGDNESGDRYKGVCDKDGCDWAAYRLGQHEFYGTGKTIDTTKPFTLVTQFITTDGTDGGDLKEVRRIYIQNGVEIANTQVNLPGISPHDSVTDAYCGEVKAAFSEENAFQTKGGLKAMGDALDRGMVLALSLWDDHYAKMHWLDAVYPDGGTDLGDERGPCPRDGGDPADLENSVPNSSVKYSNLKIGNIGTTY